MHDRFLSGAALVAAVAIAGALFACAHDQSTSPQSAARSEEAMAAARPAMARTRPARVADIQQRAALVKQRGLTAVERARVAELAAKYQWVGALHHAAMQEAIHDASLRAARDVHATAARCEAQLRYLDKYSPQVEAHTGLRFKTAVERHERMRVFASRVGDCPAVPLAATSIPAPTITAASAELRPFNHLRPDTMSTRWADYVSSITAGLRTAKSLDDAREMIDAHVAVAAADDSLSAVGLGIVAAAASLTTSSAIEWDSYFRPQEESLFLWGWLSKVGGYVVGIVTSDVGGCAAGAGASMDAADWNGDVASFTDSAAGDCASGGIVGSFLAAI